MTSLWSESLEGRSSDFGVSCGDSPWYGISDVCVVVVGRLLHALVGMPGDLGRFLLCRVGDN